MTTVLIITAKGCLDCLKVKSLIDQAGKSVNVPIIFKELDVNSEEAIEKALLYGMNSVPSFVIRGSVFNTANPSMNEITNLLTNKTNKGK